MSCSTNSGFPSAAAAMRSSVPGGSPPCEQRFHEALALALGQRLEQDRGRVRLPARPAGPDFEKLGPGQAEEQDRRLARPFRDVLDEVEKGGLGPVDVVQHDDERICPPSVSSSRRAARKLWAVVSSPSANPTISASWPQPLRRRARPRSEARPSVWRPPESPLRQAAAAPTISASGQNVMPSPYGRQRPRTTRCRSRAPG